MAGTFDLILVRHGETDSNRTKLIQGHRDTPLSTVGEEQVLQVAKELTNTRLDLVVSSDLQRALRTGEAIVAANASVSSLETWQEARERCFGEFEGQPAEMLITASTKAKEVGKLKEWGPEGGETGEQFRARVKAFLMKLCKAVPLNEDSVKPIVLVTSHGGFIKEFNCMIVEEFNCEMPGKKGEHQRICPNTGISWYTIELDQAGSLSSIQCTMLHSKDHLGNLEGPEPVLYGV